MEDLSKWCSEALGELGQEFGDDDFWSAKVAAVHRPRAHVGVHLAIFVEPFLGFMLDGTKTIESRFALRRLAPYGQVSASDVVFLKAASGPVVGICQVGQVWNMTVDGLDDLASIRRRFGKAMRAESQDFWDSRRSAAFATLMKVSEVRTLRRPMSCPKKDRRGWVVLRESVRTVERIAA